MARTDHNSIKVQRTCNRELEAESADMRRELRKNLKTVEEIKAAIEAAVPGAGVEVVPNTSVSAQHSLRIAHQKAPEIASFLRDDPELAFDYLSNVSGVDWPDKEIAEKVKVTREVKKVVDGVEQTVQEAVDETHKRIEPGYLESVYHLFSIAKKHGPLVIRMKTANRTDQVEMPSLTPVWRGAEFQEREVFDLYGIVFKGHPDLRRILMWDGFKDFPMRRDYVEPDDYEYEPTAHDQVLARAQTHKDRDQGSDVRDSGTPGA
jgi:NADH-quinone oxidoreductase subunit C